MPFSVCILRLYFCICLWDVNLPCLLIKCVRGVLFNQTFCTSFEISLVTVGVQQKVLYVGSYSLKSVPLHIYNTSSSRRKVLPLH